MRDGTIDVIASDHRPQDQDPKRLPFLQAETGIVGLETLLPLTLALNYERDIPLIDLIDADGCARRAAGHEGRKARSRPPAVHDFRSRPRLDRRSIYPAKQVEKPRSTITPSKEWRCARWSVVVTFLPARLTHDRPDQRAHLMALYRCGFCGGLSIGVDTIRAGLT